MSSVSPSISRVPSMSGERNLISRVIDPRAFACGLAALLLIAIWVATAILIRSAHRTAAEHAAATTRELAQTYEAHALRALREIDHTLHTVKYAYDVNGAATALAELDKRGLLPPELLFEVSIVDAAGAVVASTQPGSMQDVSHEDFFLEPRAKDALFIARPRQAASGEWQLLFARRLDLLDGSFGGIVFIAVDAAYFVSNYDVAAFGQQGLLALTGNDHIVRVRRVGESVSSGQTALWSKVVAHAHDGKLGGALIKSDFDGVERFVSTRPLNGFPIAVEVGLSREEQLVKVAADMRSLLVTAVLSSLLVAGATTALARMGWKLVKIRRREQQTRLTAAREAGMAEIATNILHNVGNALNSVNVSATLVSDGFQQSKVAGLARAVALMREHESALGEFLTSDTRGKHLPAYLFQVTQALQSDQAASLAHLQSLRNSVEHIKKIVTMQQMLAKTSALEEEVDLVDLMEMSLQMNVDALGRHEVTVERDFEPAPPVVLDKHGVLQILMNLISNAKHACSESERPDRVMTLRVRRNGNAMELSVTDNGVGIASENLTRIFQHGFTTRTKGHGFGLHSSALTAREIGGTLHAHSDGLGLGATFTLTIPLQASQAFT